MEKLLEKMIDLLEKISKNTEPSTSTEISITGNSARVKINFNPKIELDEKKQYEMALVNLNTYYSFPNIDGMNNNFRYAPDNGTTWFNVDIPENCYEVHHLNDYIKRIMKDEGHFDNDADQPHISIQPNRNTLKSQLYIAPNYKVDFSTENSIRSVLGFNSQVYDSGFHESENIVNIIGVNSIRVTNDLIGSCYSNGTTENIIYCFFPTVGPGFKVIQEPAKPVFLPITLSTISSMETKVTDQTGRLLNLRGEELSIKFHIRQAKG